MGKGIKNNLIIVVGWIGMGLIFSGTAIAADKDREVSSPTIKGSASDGVRPQRVNPGDLVKPKLQPPVLPGLVRSKECTTCINNCIEFGRRHDYCLDLCVRTHRCREEEL